MVNIMTVNFSNDVSFQDIKDGKIAIQTRDWMGRPVFEIVERSPIVRKISSIFTKSKLFSGDELLTLVKQVAKTPSPAASPKDIQPFESFSKRLMAIEAKRHWVRAADKIRSLTNGKKLINKVGFTGVTLTPPYWQEMLLPEHPSQIGYESAFEEWKDDQSTKLPFEEWIKERGLSFPSVRYFQENDRTEFAVAMKEGKLMRQNGEPLFTAEDEFIFVIGPDQVMYAYEKKVGNQHHSSAFSGEAIISGGTIKTDAEGKIIELSNMSGHYKPNRQNLLDTLQILKQRDVDLSGVKLFEMNGEDGIDFYYSSAERFFNLKGICEKDGYLSFSFEKNEAGECIGLKNTDHHLSRRDIKEGLGECIKKINISDLSQVKFTNCTWTGSSGGIIEESHESVAHFLNQ